MDRTIRLPPIGSACGLFGLRKRAEGDNGQQRRNEAAGKQRLAAGHLGACRADKRGRFSFAEPGKPVELIHKQPGRAGG